MAVSEAPTSAAVSSTVVPPTAFVRPLWQRVAFNQQTVLATLLIGEIILFGVIGTNFFKPYNAFEIVRANVELGLLALALTPVIVTGGIDLSVGSLLGLCAILFGKLTRDAHVPIALAAVSTLGIGALAGGLNALLVTALRIPPLIVTLGTYSLFSGVAEGITRGTQVYDFSARASFIFLGQGYFWDGVPAQAPVLLVAAVGFWLLLHRTTIGRGLMAIGFSPDGARYAGIPVEARLALVYILSGVMSGLAAVIYVAHVGQAKANAGTGYELMAITAVVLGGTSIFGGRGTVLGTILGLFAVAVLQNGLMLADQPIELGKIIGGVLLIVAIAGNQWLAKLSAGRRRK
jgi:ribose/xylose/arabinose/galactoside ABC-type transport system permease subunit